MRSLHLNSIKYQHFYHLQIKKDIKKAHEIIEISNRIGSNNTKMQNMMWFLHKFVKKVEL